MSNKKGVLAIISVMILILLITTVLLLQSKPYSFTTGMGERQAAILDVYVQGELTRDYIWNAAELSLQAVDEQAQEGDSLEELFGNKFEQYLKAHPADTTNPESFDTLYDVLQYKYEITESPLSVKGFPHSETAITLENREYDVTHTVNSYFEASLE